MATLTFGLLFVATVQGTSLCEANEHVGFSCRINPGRYVSLCLRPDESGISYRFGRIGKVELEHTDKLGKSSSFFYAKLNTATMDAFHVGFERSGYTYTVYRDTNLDTEATKSGVRVQIAERTSDVDIVCKGGIVDDDFDKLTNFRCDMDQVLGCDYADRKAAGYIQ